MLSLTIDLDMGVLTKAAFIFDLVIRYLFLAAGIILLCMMLYVSADVATTNLVKQPLPYVIEISELFLLAITLFTATWVLKLDGHVEVDIVVSRLKPGQRYIINIITSILCLISCLVITWYGADVTADFFQRDVYTPGVLEIPKAPLLLIIPVAFFLLSIQFIRRSYSNLCSWRELRGTAKD